MWKIILNFFNRFKAWFANIENLHLFNRKTVIINIICKEIEKYEQCIDATGAKRLKFYIKEAAKSEGVERELNKIVKNL